METVERYGRAARWFHAGIYVTVLALLATGWWFVFDGYRGDSPLARATGVSDGDVHTYAGYLMAAVVVLWLPVGARGIASFIRESLRFQRGDGRWLASWPRAVFSGRFGPHRGHFDPGQRLANIAVVITLAVLLLSGFGMIYLPGNTVPGVDLRAIHRWSTFLVTPVLLGHIMVASGILPGYHGVWRSMHLGGRLRREVAARIWPSWLDESDRYR